jgi:UDP:flavonoid glycosyltransferase YjiC (YdhE family)
MLSDTTEAVIGWVHWSELNCRMACQKIVGNRTYINYLTNSTLRAPLNEDMQRFVNNQGWEESGSSYRMTLMDQCFGFGLVKITKEQMLPLYVMMNSRGTGDNLRVDVPWIKLDVKSIIKSQSLFSIKHITVNPYIFRSFCMRTLTESTTTFDDLLAYARTMASAYETSETSFRLKNNIDAAVLMNSAYAAWYYSVQLSSKYKTLINMFKYVSEFGDLMKLNIFSLLKEILDSFGMISDAASYLTELANSELKLQTMRFGFVTNVLSRTDKELTAIINDVDCQLVTRAGAAMGKNIVVDEDDDENEVEPDTKNVAIKKMERLNTIKPYDKLNSFLRRLDEDTATEMSLKGDVQLVKSSNDLVMSDLPNVLRLIKKYVSILKKMESSHGEVIARYGNLENFVEETITYTRPQFILMKEEYLKLLIDTEDPIDPWNNENDKAMMSEISKGLTLLDDSQPVETYPMAGYYLMNIYSTLYWLDKLIMCCKDEGVWGEMELIILTYLSEDRIWQEDGDDSSDDPDDSDDENDDGSDDSDSDSGYGTPKEEDNAQKPQKPDLRERRVRWSDGKNIEEDDKVKQPTLSTRTPVEIAYEESKTRNIERLFKNKSNKKHKELASAIMATLDNVSKESVTTLEELKNFTTIEEDKTNEGDLRKLRQEIIKIMENKNITINDMYNLGKNMDDKPLIKLTTETEKMSGFMEEVLMIDNEIVEKWKNQFPSNDLENKPCKCGKPHIIVSAFGSIGEAVPLLKCATLLAKDKRRHVIFQAMVEEALRVPDNIKFWKVKCNVEAMQSTVIDAFDNLGIMEVMIIVTLQAQAMLLQTPMDQDNVKCMIANVINHAANPIAQWFGCELKWTSAAVEGKMNNTIIPHDLINRAADLISDQVINIPRAINNLAWYRVFNNLSIRSQATSSSPAQQVICMMPKELVEGTNIVERFKAEYDMCLNRTNLSVTREMEIVPKNTQLLILIGSTYNKKWTNLILKVIDLLEKSKTKLRIVLAISSKPLTEVCNELGYDNAKQLLEKTGINVTNGVDYNSVGNSSVVITHGGAGVTCNVIDKECNLIITPMIGDNYINAELLKLKCDATVIHKPDQLMLEHLTKNSKRKKEKVLNVSWLTPKEATQKLENWLKGKTLNYFNCRCKKRHNLIYFVGTRGDYNSIVPAASKLLAGDHNVLVTCKDFSSDCPSNWTFLPIDISSTEMGELGKMTLSKNFWQLLDAKAKYDSLQNIILDALNKIERKFEFTVTTFYSPFSTTLCKKFEAKGVIIDAIPNRTFNISDKDVITGLPMAMAEMGYVVKDKFLEILDKTKMNIESTPISQQIEITTCPVGMYNEYTSNSPLCMPLNDGSIKSTTVDKKTRDKFKKLTTIKLTEKAIGLITMQQTKLHVLISFGSIPCKERAESIVKDSLPQNIILSGTGNEEYWSDDNRYVKLINYNDDLEKINVMVHHGGVGTTMSCMKAGVFQIIWPIFGDQFIWAEMVVHKKIGIRINSIKDMKTALGKLNHNDSVRRAIREVSKPMLNTSEEDVDKIKLAMGLQTDVDMNKLRLPVSILQKQNTSIFDIKEGTYALRDDMPFTTIYDPNCADYCVSRCLNEVFEMDLEDVKSIINLKNPTFSELKAYLAVLEINHAIYYNNTWTHLSVYNSDNPIIWMVVEIRPNSLHATLCHPQIDAKKLKLLNLKQTEVIKDEHREILMDNYNISYGPIPSMLMELVNNVNKLFEVERDNIQNLMLRNQRRDDAIAYALLNEQQTINTIHVYQGVTNWKATHDSIWWTANTSNKEETIIYTAQLDQECVIVQLTNLEGVLTNVVGLSKIMGPVMGGKGKIFPKISSPDKWVFINKIAKTRNKLKRFVGCDVWNGSVGAKLIVNCVDNLKHDMYDVKEQLLNCSEYILPEGCKRTIFENNFFKDDKECFLQDVLYVQVLDTKTELTKTQRAYLNVIVGQQNYRTAKTKLLIKNAKKLKRIDELQLGSVAEYEEVMTLGELKTKHAKMDEDEWTSVLGKLSIKLEQKVKLDKTFKVNEFQVTSLTIMRSTVLSKTSFILSTPLMKFDLVLEGGASGANNPTKDLAEDGLPKKYAWMVEGEDTERKKDDWWGLKEKLNPGPNPGLSKIDLSNVNRYDQAEAVVMNQNSDDKLMRPPDGKGSVDRWQYVDPILCNNELSELGICEDDPHYDAMVLWSDTDMFDWLQIKLPQEGKIISKEWPQRIIDSKKYTLKEYPTLARPVFSKAAFSEHKSISTRLHTVKVFRKRKPKLGTLVAQIFEAYFHKDAKNYCDAYMNSAIYFDPEETVKWMKAHHSPDKVHESLMELFGGDLYKRAISEINVHQKIESLLKDADKVIFKWEHQESRIIAWQRYAVAAIFSPVFKKAKNRIKKLLKSKVVYADGLTPDMLSSFLRGTRNAKYMFSNDLSKQDKQTDECIIDCEMEIYKLLGVHIDVVNVWRSVHKTWRYRASMSTGWRKAMRTTGQATTAIGNLITNMQCHAEFIIKQDKLIEFVLMLGDDNSMGFKSKPTVKNLRKNIRDNFNMLSKDETTEVGVFCQFLVYNTPEGFNEVGPDYIRLKNRFEVTNGVGEVNEENLKMRAMSYAMTLGATPEVTHLIENQHWPISPTSWYNQQACIEACAKKYNVEETEVMRNYNILIKYMTERTVYEHKLKIFDTKPRKY